ncbi:acyltransferase family protein [Commensalibacter oyaizuii]|uniref:Acyltransferase n=1 Tax=Commensalibacter oyaizuii TaxID=3043873 RepID=A0ABT6PYI3_9PROT|nr:acyltransferase [Commensalibacter sp. TBRC 16381]MDI2089778.1 acyltransferase [Commensalibacter sp. TBRC 16381]
MNITYSTLWPSALIMAILLTILTLPVFKGLYDSDDTRNRVHTIDGLRGFLAFGVVFSHGQCFYNITAIGQCTSNSAFYSLLGTIAVRLFFMITAYLFWSQLLYRQGQMQWQSFYIKRFFRIAPVYWFMCLCVFLIVMIETQWTLRVSFFEFCKQIGAWLALGILSLPDINTRLYTGMLVVMVTWTLRYEWLFYVLLPCISFFAVHKKRALWFISAGLWGVFIGSWFVDPHSITSQFFSVLFMFLVGMLCATLQYYQMINLKWHNWVKSVLIITAIMIICAGDLYDKMYILNSILGFIFYLIISGCSLFGVLTLKSSQKMGEVSYGIYLLQGIIFNIVYSQQVVKQYVIQGPWHFWYVMMGICVGLLLLAIIVHVILEKPAIRIGQYLSLKIKNY